MSLASPRPMSGQMKFQMSKVSFMPWPARKPSSCEAGRARVAQLRWGARRAHPPRPSQRRRPRLGNAEHEGNLDAAGEGELWEGGERERDAEQLAHQVRGREQARSEEWQQISLLPDRRQGLRRCRVRRCRSRCFSPIALHLDRDQTSLSSKPNGSKAKRDCAVWLAPSVIYVCSFP